MSILTVQEDEYIRAQLTAALSGLGSIRATLANALPSRLQGKLVDGILLPHDLIDYALRICDDDGYATEPPSFYVFLRNSLPNDGRVQLIIERIKYRPPPPLALDAFDSVMLDSQLPFLGRPLVRVYLRALLEALPTQPIVVINGKSKIGKTYTTELIGHARRYHSKMLPCHVEVQEKEGLSVGPRELACDVITQLGADPDRMPPPTTNLDRWAQELANWIISTAQSSKKNCWIALDGFNKSELRLDTLTLIVKLATSITKGAARKNHRLILIDFDHTNLLVQPGMIALESIGGIEMKCVNAFVTNLIRQANEIRGPADEKLDVAVINASVIDGFGDPIDDLPVLANRLQALMATLSAPQ